MSDKIKAVHLERPALLYVRQSSAYQVLHNPESQKLQYAMQDRLRQLGWTTVEIIDEDLGRSAAGRVIRSGFERMVVEVSLGRVGTVAAREVSRFARNSREWQQLVEVCRVVDTLLIDQEMVYSPRQSNDRLLLGLKGSLNEYELDLLRQRSLEARYDMARRGELFVVAPVGYVKTDGGLEKDPDRRVQDAIRLVFRQVLATGSVRQTLLWFLEHDLQLPVRGPHGETLWRRPAYSTVYQMATHPVYGGAYVYGKTENVPLSGTGETSSRRRRKPRERWLSLIPGTHEGYLSWEEFERIQQMVSENIRGPGRGGAPKHDGSLLAGLLRCRRCGRKLMVNYTGGNHSILRYECRRGALDNGEPRCITLAGQGVEDAIACEVLRVVQPAAIDAAILAGDEAAQRQDEVRAALTRDLEAARYAAQRAQRQYDAADPENRLVTEELEYRWNQALQRVRDLEQRIDEESSRRPSDRPPIREEFEALAAHLDRVWQHPDADLRLKRRIVRTLVEEIVVDVNVDVPEVILLIHWKGGVHTEHRVHRRRRGQSGSHTAPSVIEAVRVLVRVCSDDVIAGLLNRNGHRTGRGNWWTRERLTSLRSHHHIPGYQPDVRAAEGWMNLTEAAQFLGVSARTLRLAVERGAIEAQHPLAQGPWVFSRQALETDAAARLVKGARQRGGTPTVPDPRQATLDFSST
jgi:DNA invertase Pin-like site-specific DNA recombinase